MKQQRGRLQEKALQCVASLFIHGFITHTQKPLQKRSVITQRSMCILRLTCASNALHEVATATTHDENALE